MSGIFTVEFNSSVQAFREEWRRASKEAEFLGWKPQMDISISKLLNPTPLTRAQNPFPWRYRFSAATFSLMEIRLAASVPWIQMFRVCRNTTRKSPPSRTWVQLDSSLAFSLPNPRWKWRVQGGWDSKSSRAGFCRTRDNVASLPFFFFLDIYLNQTFYIPQAAKHQKRSNTN